MSEELKENGGQGGTEGISATMRAREVKGKGGTAIVREKDTTTDDRGCVGQRCLRSWYFFEVC